MKYSLIIFDWDGTLMNSIEKIVSCVKQAAIENNLDVPTSVAIRNIIGLSLDVAMAKLFPEYSVEVQQSMKNAYRDQYLNGNDQPTPFYDGIKEWLVSLKEQGYILAVATGKGRNGLDRILHENGVYDLFSVTYCADETNSKPHPLMLNNILEDLDIPANQALMVGDSTYDLEMANNANIACVGVSYGVHSSHLLSQYKPIAIVDDLPKELSAYL